MCFLQFTLWQLQNASSCDTFSYLKPVSAIFVAYFLSARKVVKKWHFNCKLLKYEIKFTQKQCQISGLAIYLICRKVTFSEWKLFLIKINLKCKRKKKLLKNNDWNWKNFYVISYANLTNILTSLESITKITGSYKANLIKSCIDLWSHHPFDICIRLSTWSMIVFTSKSLKLLNL